MHNDKVLVLGATGTIGRRVASQLESTGVRVRRASGSGDARFRWEDPATWSPAVRGADAVFVMAPDGVEVDPEFLAVATDAGVHRLVLLSSKGIEVMGDQRLMAAERAVKESGLE